MTEQTPDSLVSFGDFGANRVRSFTVSHEDDLPTIELEKDVLTLPDGFDVGFLRGMYVVGLTDTTQTLSGRIERVEEGPPVTIHIESMPWSQLSDRHQKGERNERQANTILNRVYRGERVDAFGNTDPFHLADLIGIQAEYPTLFVQVKTNEFSAADRQYYRRWARGKIDNSHTVFEVWVREDRTGWTMHRYVLTGETSETGEFTPYYQTNTCNPSQVRDDWATAFEETLPPNRNGDSPSNI